MRGLRSVLAPPGVAMLLFACAPDVPDASAEAENDAINSDIEEAGDPAETVIDLGGASVEVFGAPAQIEERALNSVIETHFNEPFNAQASYEGSDNFEEEIRSRIEAGTGPDVALYPQPGAVIEQAAAGNAVALEDLGFDIVELRATFGDYLVSLGEYEGKHYAIPTNVSLKSLVWYHLPTFDAQGYQEPATWDELVGLSEQMVDDGYTPWCIGTGSGAATGWPATDWLEDIVLRSAGPDAYDRWVDGELAFDSPEITEAAELMAQITHQEGFVSGGTGSIPDRDFRESVQGLIGDDPDCLMHRQASFIVSYFPEEARIGEDVEVFSFPQVDGGDGALIAGELSVAFADRDEVREFLRVFTGRDAQCAQGSFEEVARISPNIETSADCYQDPVVALSAETVLGALEEGTARFDASDLMPSAVGSGSFWEGMNDWMRGADLPEVLSDIEQSWPR